MPACCGGDRTLRHLRARSCTRLDASLNRHYSLCSRLPKKTLPNLRKIKLKAAKFGFAELKTVALFEPIQLTPELLDDCDFDRDYEPNCQLFEDQVNCALDAGSKLMDEGDRERRALIRQLARCTTVESQLEFLVSMVSTRTKE